MPKGQRDALEAEGYVEGIDTPAPAVGSMTTTVAGIGVTQFLQLLTDFMGAQGAVARLNYNIVEGTVRREITNIKEVYVCRNVRGFGDLRPLHTLRDPLDLDR